MTFIPDRATSLLVEDKASMENWDAFIQSASTAIERDLKDEGKAYKLKLAYEELISNIIKASANTDDSKEVNLKIYSGISTNYNDEKIFTLQTEDNGIQFDPGFSEESDVDVNQDINQRAIGGLGIFLIKQSVDMASYAWVNGLNTNQLSMRMDGQSIDETIGIEHTSKGDQTEWAKRLISYSPVEKTNKMTSLAVDDRHASKQE